MSLTSDLQDVADELDTLSSQNKVVNFAYNESAYNSNVISKDEENGNCIPSASEVEVNARVLNKGFRDQSSSFARQFINHFCGRASFNLNKTKDVISSLTNLFINKMGVAGGYATLDSDGRVPSSQITQHLLEYQGTWNAQTNTPDLTAVHATKGDLYFVSAGGSQDIGNGVEVFHKGDQVIYNGDEWQKILSGNVDTVNLLPPDSDGNAVITGKDITLSGNLDFEECSFDDTNELVNDVAYGNGKWVCATNSDFIYSEDGINWRAGAFASWTVNRIIYADSMFVAVGESWSSDGSMSIAYSTDGLNWYKATKNWSEDLDFYSVCYGNGKWVAGSDTMDAMFFYSSDGINWYKANNPSDVQETVANIYYLKGIFLACTWGVGVWWSSDGINWQQGSGMSYESGSTLAYNGSIFVYVSAGIAYTSTDGKNWTEHSGTFPYGTQFSSVAYGGGVFIAYAENTVGASCAVYSYDGINWFTFNTDIFTMTSTVSKRVRGINYAGGIWTVLVWERLSQSPYTNTYKVYQSLDGIHWSIIWTYLPSINAYYLISVYYSNGKWFIAGNTETGETLYYADQIYTLNTALKELAEKLS